MAKLNQTTANALKLLADSGLSIVVASHTLGFSDATGYLLRKANYNYDEYLQGVRDREKANRTKKKVAKTNGEAPKEVVSTINDASGDINVSDTVITTETTSDTKLENIGALLAEINLNISRLLDIELEKKAWRDARTE